MHIVRRIWPFIFTITKTSAFENTECEGRHRRKRTWCPSFLCLRNLAPYHFERRAWMGNDSEMLEFLGRLSFEKKNTFWNLGALSSCGKLWLSRIPSVGVTWGLRYSVSERFGSARSTGRCSKKPNNHNYKLKVFKEIYDLGKEVVIPQFRILHDEKVISFLVHMLSCKLSNIGLGYAFGL